ncbi:MAG TPA: MFS transporter [Methylotenera sp.]|nr:MFS transporter [Methylotenera sp.]HPH05428.1 MFS transporter [Methylotenera sp.]HPN01505.1 MFS transporter [Methylotenera sp.]
MMHTEKMSPQERQASMSLASIYGLRMLGMFLILPIFSIYAAHYEGGNNSVLVGAALGAYGLTQALFQLPFGMASDKFGRKKMIYIGLGMLIMGSVIAALATDIYMVIIGRAVQGAGAVSAVVTALLADLTREEHRTKAMATIGATIGVTFAISLVLGPALAHGLGIAGIFWLTAILATLAVMVIKFAVPNPQISHFHSDASAAPAKLNDVLKNGQLLRLNYGIFALHAAQMAMFIVVPLAIQNSSSLDVNHHWQVYLPILMGSFLLMIPAIVMAEKKGQLKTVFISAVALMLLAQLSFAGLITHFWGIIASLFAYFVAFNILEASLPSLISKLAPAAAKGTAMGVYNTAQSLGVAVGGLAGGYLAHHYGQPIVFVFCAVLMSVWLLLTLSMKAPPSVRTKMYHLPDLNEQQAKQLADKITNIADVHEAVAIAKENMLIVKLNNQQSAEQLSTIEQKILELIGANHGISE